MAKAHEAKKAALGNWAHLLLPNSVHFLRVMIRKTSLVLTLAAWLLATGSQWDLVQVFAWGRMFATYSQSLPLGRAVERTFSPETMCSLCHAVAAAKQQQSRDENSLPGGKAAGKILLVFAPRALVFLSPALLCAGLTAAVMVPLSAERATPPSPPPRTLV